jgi:uncharacterized membrane protein YkoI
MKRRTVSLAAGLLVAAFTTQASPRSAHHEVPTESTIALSATPAAVQAAITKAAGTGTVTAVEEGTLNGQTYYEARITDTAGKVTVVVVDSNGTVVSHESSGPAGPKETPIALNATPAAVQAAITKAAGTGTVTSVEEGTFNGQTYYEAKITDAAGKVTVVVVDSNGTVVSHEVSHPNAPQETPIALNATPAAVQAAITKAAGTGTVTSVEEETFNGQTYYEAKITDAAGKVTIVVVDSNGTVVSHESSGPAEPQETPIALGATPAAVQAAITKAAGTGTVTAVEEETRNGQTYYEAKITDAAGKVTVVVVDSNGTVVSHTPGSGTPPAPHGGPGSGHRPGRG